MITVTTNYYTPYPMQRPWSRLSHSLMAVHLMAVRLMAVRLMAVRLMFTSCQILHHAYRTASHLGYAPHVLLMYYNIGYL